MKKLLFILLFIPLAFTCTNDENAKKITIEEIKKNKSSFPNQQQLYINSINDDDSFFGHWKSDDSNFYLTINDKGFTSYKFIAYQNKEGNLSWNRIYSPGKEVFVKKEDNVIVTNYWIDEQEFYTKVTYTLISEDSLTAEFNGKLKGEFYYRNLKYKKVDFKK